MITRHLSRFWLLLGVAALAVAGLFSLVLVVARTPQLAAFGDIFHSSLVVHVDLSVLVWFLASACMIWSVEAQQRRAFIVIPYLEEAALLAMAAGAALISISPLAQGEALMSNYIPVIANPVFFLGLALTLCGLLLMLAHVLLRLPGNSALAFGAYAAAFCGVMALLALVWAHRQMPKVIEGQQYYDLLFWAGGHVLQLLHTQMCMIAWLLLAYALMPRFAPSRRLLLALFSIAPLVALFTPLAFMKYGVASQEFRLFFTHAMIGADGIAPAVLGMIIVVAISSPRRGEGRRGAVNLDASQVRPHPNPPPTGEGITSSLIMSLMLFTYGGLIGLAIHGENVTIPAHYHGSIVGVTLAFMGLAYVWLPRFGYAEVARTRLAFWQPIIYGGGQILHISGFAWSGGYGVLRKTPGALEGGFTSAKAAMGLMGIGGLLAVIGGFMFVIVVARSVWKAKNA